MRNAQRDVCNAHALADLLCFAMQQHCWPATKFADHFQVHPANAAPPAGAQRLHRSFFSGKAAGETFVFVAESFAIRALFRGVNASQKGFAAALNRSAHTFHFGDIYAKSDNQRRTPLAAISK